MTDTLRTEPAAQLLADYEFTSAVLADDPWFRTAQIIRQRIVKEFTRRSNQVRYDRMAEQVLVLRHLWQDSGSDQVLPRRAQYETALQMAALAGMGHGESGVRHQVAEAISHANELIPDGDATDKEWLTAATQHLVDNWL